MDDGRTIARQTGLVVVAFLATFILLAGGWALIGRAGAPSGSHAPTGSIVVIATARGSLNAPGPGSLSPAPTLAPGATPTTPPTITIVGAGDIADCASDGALRTSDLLLRETGSVFTAGDNADPDGSAANFADCYAPTWGRVVDRTILPAAGEQDWLTAGAAGYLDYFGTPANPNGTTWYSTDLGAWHVVVLDSDCAAVGGCDAASPQGRWLAKDLAESTAHCTLAIWHRPRFSSGESGNDPAVTPFWDALHAARAELIINGHDHDYERFAPQDPAGNVERPGGIREIVVGTGGAELGQFTKQAAHSEFRQAGTFGVLRLTLHPFKYDWEFVPVTGEIADAGSTPCH